MNDYRSSPPQREEGEDTSVFGSVSWYVTPKLKFGAGLRYDRAKRLTRQRAGQLDLGLGTIITYRDATLAESFNAWLPRLSVVYQFTEDFSVHASAARGYIPGGFNLTAIQEGIIDDDVLTYDSESLWSREIGFKWRSPGRRLRASGAIFYITSDNWQEIQIATDDSGRPVSSDYISSDASMHARGDAVQKAVTIYGLQFGYETDRFSIRLFGENLTDERRASGLAIENMAFGSDSLFYAPLDAPRVIGIELEAWL